MFQTGRFKDFDWAMFFIILSICGAFAGVAWHYAMRWVFQLIQHGPPRDP